MCRRTSLAKQVTQIGNSRILETTVYGSPLFRTVLLIKLNKLKVSRNRPGKMTRADHCASIMPRPIRPYSDFVFGYRWLHTQGQSRITTFVQIEWRDSPLRPIINWLIPIYALSRIHCFRDITSHSLLHSQSSSFVEVINANPLSAITELFALHFVPAASLSHRQKSLEYSIFFPQLSVSVTFLV